MMEARDARFARLYEILMAGQPVPYPEEEVEADVAEAIAAVRRNMLRVDFVIFSERHHPRTSFV
jgi:hypothetical protein